MTNKTPEQIIKYLKIEGLFWAAGVISASANLPRVYGCHFGMRSTLEASRNEFNRGYDEKKLHLAKQGA